MCGGQNSLSKGGLNAKAGFCYPYNNRYISFLPSDDTEIFISRKEDRLIDVEEELGVLKDMPDDEAYYKDGYCTKCKALIPTKTAYNKIKPNAIKFCFNCGVKINGVLWTLIEEGIIKEK